MIGSLPLAFPVCGLSRLLESIETTVPHRRKLSAQPNDLLAIGPVEPLRALPTDRHEIARQQYTEMLRHGGTRHVELGGDLTRRTLLAPYEREDLPARAVSQGAQHRIHGGLCRR